MVKPKKNAMEWYADSENREIGRRDDENLW